MNTLHISKETETKLIILCGIPFAGKSTFAGRLERSRGYIRIDLDEIKFDLYGSHIKDEELTQADWDRIYKKMYYAIESHLDLGHSIIHDTGNFTVKERRTVQSLAQARGIPFITILIHLDLETARKRLLANRVTHNRFDISNESFEEAASELELPELDENPLVFDSTAATISEFIVKNRL